MAKKDLKWFMRENKPEIITVKGPETIKDGDGNVIDLEIKVLSQEEITRINDAYKKRTIATDKKGQPYISGGEVVFKTERDSAKATRHIIVEALQYPDLKDEELMKYYNCFDITEMPLKVFPKPEEFAHVSRVVFAALGIGTFTDEDEERTESDIAEAKN